MDGMEWCRGLFCNLESIKSRLEMYSRLVRLMMIDAMHVGFLLYMSFNSTGNLPLTLWHALFQFSFVAFFLHFFKVKLIHVSESCLAYLPLYHKIQSQFIPLENKVKRNAPMHNLRIHPIITKQTARRKQTTNQKRKRKRTETPIMLCLSCSCRHLYAQEGKTKRKNRKEKKRTTHSWCGWDIIHNIHYTVIIV